MEKQSFKCIGGISLPLRFLLLSFLCIEGLPIDLGRRLLIAWIAYTCVPPEIQFPPLSLNLAGTAVHVKRSRNHIKIGIQSSLDADDAPCCNARTRL